MISYVQVPTVPQGLSLYVHGISILKFGGSYHSSYSIIVSSETVYICMALLRLGILPLVYTVMYLLYTRILLLYSSSSISCSSGV